MALTICTYSLAIPRCTAGNRLKHYPAPQETIKTAYITQTSELLIGAERGGERRRGKTGDENRLITCIDESFTHTDKGDVLFIDCTSSFRKPGQPNLQQEAVKSSRRPHSYWEKKLNQECTHALGCYVQSDSSSWDILDRQKLFTTRYDCGTVYMVSSESLRMQ